MAVATALPAVIVAVPSYLVLRRLRAVNLVSCLVGGFLSAAIPFLASYVLSATTFVGAIVIAVGFGLFGLVAGLVFWSALWFATRHDEPGHESADGRTSKTAKGTRGRSVFWTNNGLVLCSVALFAAVALAPEAVKDRSCHNMFRDTSETTLPVLYMDVDLQDRDLNHLESDLRDFSQRRQLSFLISDQERRFKDLRVDLCNDVGLNITFAEIDRYSYASESKNVPGHVRVRVAVYKRTEGVDWAMAAAEVFEMLERSWPGSVFFSDGQGNAVPAPPDLRPILGRGD
jgi:hypothetical protein